MAACLLLVIVDIIVKVFVTKQPIGNSGASAEI